MAEETQSYFLIWDGTKRPDILTYTATQGITQSKTYHFRLTAANVVGVSEFSPTLDSLAAIVPSTPLNFALAGSGFGVVSFTWTTSSSEGGSPITGYYIYYRLNSEAWLQSNLIDEAANYFDLTGLAPNELYSFKIAAVN